jgi:DNA processing protein
VDFQIDASPQPRCDAGDRTPARTSPASAGGEPSARAAELQAALCLLSVPGIGVARLRALREAFGGFTAALAADPAFVSGALRLDVAESARMLSAARQAARMADVERACAEGQGVSIRMLADDDYPDLLRASPDPPELLFVRGALGAVPEPAVAVVGSRRATAYGKLEAGRLAAELAERGVTIVSGGARGIDAEAHRGAMRAGGRTIAVLASGFAHPYPPEHGPLFDAIVDAGGAVLTEQLSGIEPRPELFPRRNRIIAGLSLVTVVIEAAARSGALLTARIAVDDLSRDAACLPGPVGSALSVGCHKAIREGWASLVTSADDICELLVAARQLAIGAVESAARAGPLVGRHRCEGNEKEGKSGENKSGENKSGEGKDRERKNGERKSGGGQARGSMRAQGDSPQPVLSTDAVEVVVALKKLGSAVIDELALELGWEFPRLALALLELERVGQVRRDAHGVYAGKGGAAHRSN